LALKASLRLVGIEPPKWHDVGPILRREINRFPDWFKTEIPKLARISRKLMGGPSMYGSEESGTPPEELYTMEDAEEALTWAEYTLKLVAKLYDEVGKTCRQENTIYAEFELIHMSN
jgi:HEPN domain-containing protein